MKVVISTYGRFPPAFVLAGQLARRGQLEHLITPLPPRSVGEFGVERNLLRGASPIGLTNAALRRYAPAGVEWHTRLAMAAAYDRWVAARLPRVDLFNGWSGASLHSLDRARARGARTVLTTGSAHVRWQARVLEQEQAAWGLPERVTPEGILRRAELEYGLADVILVPSPFVWRTFVEEGIPEEKLRLVPWATHRELVAADRSGRTGPVRVMFLGACSVRKGVPSLLQAARRMSSPVEVRLVGVPEPAVFAAAGGLPANVTAVGRKSGAELQAEFDAADVFVLPSLEDGSALVTIEAMTAGLPVVVSDQAGAALIREGETGFTVPAGDAAAIAAAVDRLAVDPELRARVGRAARAVATARTERAYGDEVVDGVFAPLLAS